MDLPTKKRPGRPRDETLTQRRREQILDMAAAVFARQGYQDTDLQRVADALQIGKGTIYRYFPSKEELFLAVVDRGMLRLGEKVNACRQGSADPLEQIAQAIVVYLDFFRDHPEYAELLIQERAHFKDRKQQTYFIHQERNIGPWWQLVQDLINQGRIRPVPVARIIDVISDLIYGTMFTNYFTNRQQQAQDQAKDILDVIFNGILTDQERQCSPFSARPMVPTT